MKRIALLLVTTAAVFGQIGCAGSAPQEEKPAETTEEQTAPAKVMAESVKILGKISGDRLKTDGYKLAVLEDKTFTQLKLGELFADQGVDVDLTQHSVILLALGEQPTGGYAADITALQVKGQELYIQATAVAPGADSIVTQALSYPFCAVAIEKLPDGLTLYSDITSLAP